jgi:hypothetical protein
MQGFYMANISGLGSPQWGSIELNKAGGRENYLESTEANILQITSDSDDAFFDILSNDIHSLREAFTAPAGQKNQAVDPAVDEKLNRMQFHLHEIWLERRRNVLDGLENKPMKVNDYAEALCPKSDYTDRLASKQKDPIKERAEDYQAIEKLNLGLNICPIKADGHCLFTALSTGVVKELSTKPPEERAKFFQQFTQKALDSHVGEQMANWILALQNTLKDIDHPPKDPNSLTPDPNPLATALQNHHDDLISTSRNLIADHCAQNLSEEVGALLPTLPQKYETKEAYIEALKKQEYGTELQARAFSDLTGVGTEIYNINDLRKQDHKTIKPSETLAGAPMQLPLFFRGNHYCLGIKKPLNE